MPIDKYLDKLEGARNSGRTIKLQSDLSIENPESYILLEGRTHGKYSYPDLLVSINKSYNGLNWYEAQLELIRKDSFILNLRQFVDLLSLLKTEKVYDGNGSKIDEDKLENLLSYFFGAVDPWKAEWLDAYIDRVDDDIFLHFDHRFVNASITALKSEKLECFYSHKDRISNIDLDDWLKTATVRGLPPKKVKEGNFFCYLYMEGSGSLAFGSHSKKIFLVPWESTKIVDSLGVRPVKIRS